MHSFCTACLASERAAGETSQAVECPVCGLEAAYAVTGAVAHDLISVATATARQRTRCGECSNNPAQVWCGKCQVALCMDCHRVTHASRMLQAHPLEAMDGRDARPRALPKCPVHTNEHVNFIARDGVTLMCRDCVLIGASAGGAPANLVEGAIPLRDAAQAARTRLASVVDATNQRALQVRDLQRTVAAVVPEAQADFQKSSEAILRQADSLAANVDARRDALQQV